MPGSDRWSRTGEDLDSETGKGELWALAWRDPPPQAARATGPPSRMDQSREAHLAAWPLHSPEGAMHAKLLPNRAPGLHLKVTVTVGGLPALRHEAWGGVLLTAV
jgi:hypothetical protein